MELNFYSAQIETVQWMAKGCFHHTNRVEVKSAGWGWGGGWMGVRRVRQGEVYAVRVLGLSSGNRTFLRYPLLPPDSLEQRSQQT